jgi:hypothetical protein
MKNNLPKRITNLALKKTAGNKAKLLKIGGKK